MTLTQTVAPTTPAVTLEEAKAYYRILGTEEDATVQLTIDMATAKAEQITNRQLSPATYELAADSFATIRLPRPPLVSVTAVEYLDTDSVRQPWTGYETVMDGEIATVVFTDTPTDAKGGVNSVFVTFTSGYTETPALIRSFILAHGLSMFENRHFERVEGEVDDGSRAYYYHLLDSYRIIPV